MEPTLEREFFSACQYSKTEDVLYYIKQGVDVNYKDFFDNNSTALHCIPSGQKEKMKILLKNGADVNSENNFGHTPLHFFCHSPDNTVLVKILLKSGAKVNKGDREGWTPLLKACLYGIIETVKILVKNGADVNQENEKKHTSLDLASRGGHTEVAEILIKNGAKILEEFKDNPVIIKAQGNIEMKKKILNLLLCTRKKDTDSHFYQYNLPLDIFKVIIAFSEII